jgi:hypothetical protein
MGIIRNLRVLMNLQPYPVATEIPDHPITMGMGMGIYRPGDLEKPVTGFGRRNSPEQTLPGDRVKPAGNLVYPARFHGYRLIADIPPQINAAIQGNQIPLGYFPPGGNSVDHLLVDGNTEGPREGVVLWPIS